METQLMEAKQPQIEQIGHQWLRWLHRLYRDRLRLDQTPGLRRTPVIFAFVLIAAGSIITFLPVRIDSAALGDLADAGSTGVVPALCFLIGDLCLAAGMWAAITAARHRYLERLAMVALGVIAAAVAGQCLRLMLQIILLRRFYRPELLFTSPGRAAAVGWGLLLVTTLTAGFLGPLLVAAANLVPRVLADKARPLQWLAGRHWWLLLPFAALAATAIITQWVLPPSLAAAMGYTYPAPSGETVIVSLRDLGPAAWSSLQVLFALPLLVLMWEGVEAARTSHRLVKNPKGGQTTLLARAGRFDCRLAAGVVVIAVGWFAVVHGTVLPALAGAGLLVIITLSVRGDLGRVTRLSRGFERGVSRWQLPEEWRDAGRISLLFAVLALPVLIVVCGNIAVGAKAGLWFPFDLHRFYFYWHNYRFVSMPVVTASAIYGHVDALMWIICFALAAIIFIGMLINMFDKGVRGGFRAVWFLLRVGALAFLLAPVARLADHSYATFILTGCAVVAVLAAFGRRIQPAAVWSVIIVGGALTLWSLALWHTTWLPAALLVCLTVLQRFVYNAGTLNEPDPYRPNRVAYFQAIALIAVAMLVLGHGAASGYFQSDALSVVSDRVALSVVAAIWLVMFVVQQTPTTTDSPAGTTTKEPLPRSWAWVLDPHRAMVSFTGRKDELAALLAWCQNPGAEQLRLVTGFGGTGKTRLAAELAARLAQLGWAAIWAPPGQEGTAIGAAHALPSGGVLVVVDNAEIRTGGGLKQMLTALTGGGSEDMRVLLLARSAGEWCDQLAIGSAAVRNLIEQAKQAELRLPVAVTTAKADHAILAQASGSIAKHYGLREGRVETRYKTTSGRSVILDLHAAAVVATLTDASLAETGTGTVQADIRSTGAGLDQLLRHEQQFWYDCAHDHALLDGPEKTTPQALRQILAAAWLFGATSAEEASDLAARVPGVTPSPGLTEWLRDLSTAGHRDAVWADLREPRRLAELHTMRELTASPEFTQSCLTNLTAGQACQAVRFLGQAAVNYKEASTLLSKVLPNITNQITGTQSPVEALTEMVSVLPAPSTTIAPTAIVLTQQILENLPVETKPAARAYWLVYLAHRLSETAHREDAVAATQEAAILLGELADANPDRYRPDLAATLETLAVQLSELGHPEEALPPAAEAAAIYQELAAAQPGLYQPSLARALVNLSFRYREQGSTAHTVSAAENAVAAYRELASASPGRYRPGLARALASLSFWYYEQRRTADALPLAQEAAATYRELIGTSPDRYRPRLASILDNLGVYLDGQQRYADALAATKEATTLYWQLTKTSPSQYRADRARALSNLSVRYRRLGQPAKAVTPARTSVDIYRELTATKPDEYRAKLALGLSNLAKTLEASGQKTYAKKARAEAERLSELGGNDS